jgi:8-oxo-dGTP pyrophosphatase MutT (NUDIX family)
MGKSRREPAYLPTKLDEAAGGAVIGVEDDAPFVVLIATSRDGILRWSLPKGHFKKGENREEAALREVREETGLEVELVEPLGTVDYWFTEGRYRYHKWVHYYFMRSVGGDFEEHDDEVVDVRRFSWDDALRHMAYPSERKLLRDARDQAFALLGVAAPDGG